VSKTIYRRAAGFAAALLFAAGAGRSADTPAKFVGANSCASSSCHGGGGAQQNQFLVWSLKDFHSQRPTATLTTARSKQIADALEIKDPTAAARCTTCHAPLQDVAANARGDGFKVSEGVSCESCHGVAEPWLRAHTRTDYTRADRTAAGLRDLQNLYIRANVCVACHQNVNPDLLKAGHPELLFELDGQSVAEPKHWRAEKNGNGAQGWLVGQAVALREMSWQLAQIPSPDEKAQTRWAALQWLVNQVAKAIPVLPPLTREGSPFGTEQQRCDDGARALANQTWPEAWTHQLLSALAGVSGDFRDTALSQTLQARRAERLVLGLDRLAAALPELKSNAPAQAALNQLFQLAQSLPDFDSNAFAGALDRFAAALAAH